MSVHEIRRTRFYAVELLPGQLAGIELDFEQHVPLNDVRSDLFTVNRALSKWHLGLDGPTPQPLRFGTGAHAQPMGGEEIRTTAHLDETSEVRILVKPLLREIHTPTGNVGCTTSEPVLDFRTPCQTPDFLRRCCHIHTTPETLP